MFSLKKIYIILLNSVKIALKRYFKNYKNLYDFK